MQISGARAVQVPWLPGTRPKTTLALKDPTQFLQLVLYTLVSRTIGQVGIKVQVGKISKINKSAGWNKAMQVGILGILLL